MSVFKNPGLGSSLVVQWLGLGAHIAGAWVRSLVGELRSHKPWGAAKKQTNKQKKTKNKSWTELLISLWVNLTRGWGRHDPGECRIEKLLEFSIKNVRKIWEKIHFYQRLTHSEVF